MMNPGSTDRLRMIATFILLILLAGSVSAITVQQCLDQYCTPGLTACQKSCPPGKGDCGCGLIYGDPCVGECSNYAYSGDCVAPYWSGFMGCLPGCIGTAQPATRAESCQAQLEEKMDACIKAKYEKKPTTQPTNLPTTQPTNLPTTLQRTQTPTRSSVVSASPTIKTQLIAQFLAQPTSGPAPLVVDFQDMTPGTIRRWEWNFDDGITSSVQGIHHTFTEPGTYSVSLTVENNEGRRATARRTITVLEPVVAPVEPLAAKISASPTSGPAPLLVRFDDASSGKVKSREWDFGDKTRSGESSLRHEYAKPGKYTVTLTVTSPSGNKSIAQKEIIVETPSLPPTGSQPVTPEIVTKEPPGGGETRFPLPKAPPSTGFDFTPFTSDGFTEYQYPSQEGFSILDIFAGATFLGVTAGIVAGGIVAGWGLAVGAEALATGALYNAAAATASSLYVKTIVTIIPAVLETPVIGGILTRPPSPVPTTVIVEEGYVKGEKIIADLDQGIRSQLDYDRWHATHFTGEEREYISFTNTDGPLDFQKGLKKGVPPYKAEELTRFEEVLREAHDKGVIPTKKAAFKIRLDMWSKRHDPSEVRKVIDELDAQIQSRKGGMQ